METKLAILLFSLFYFTPPAYQRKKLVIAKNIIAIVINGARMVLASKMILRFLKFGLQPDKAFFFVDIYCL